MAVHIMRKRIAKQPVNVTEHVANAKNKSKQFAENLRDLYGERAEEVRKLNKEMSQWDAVITVYKNEKAKRKSQDKWDAICKEVKAMPTNTFCSMNKFDADGNSFYSYAYRDQYRIAIYDANGANTKVLTFNNLEMYFQYVNEQLSNYKYTKK